MKQLTENLQLACIQTAKEIVLAMSPSHLSQYQGAKNEKALEEVCQAFETIYSTVAKAVTGTPE